MAIEGTGFSVSFDGSTFEPDGLMSFDPIKEPEVIEANKMLEGQVITCITKFEPFLAPAIPNLTPFVITYIENRKKKRKKRPNGTMVKHSKRKMDKCKVKIAFNGVVESGDNGNVMIRKV